MGNDALWLAIECVVRMWRVVVAAALVPSKLIKEIAVVAKLDLLMIATAHAILSLHYIFQALTSKRTVKGGDSS